MSDNILTHEQALGRGREVGQEIARDSGCTDGSATLLAEILAVSYLGGRREERIASVLWILEARKLPVSEATRNRIERCKDLAALQLWWARALGVSEADEIFGERSS